MNIILLFLAKPLHKHGTTLVHITYPPLRYLATRITAFVFCRRTAFLDNKLAVQVKNHMCSHGFTHELRTFQPNTFQDMHVIGHLETRGEERALESSSYGFLRQYIISMETNLLKCQYP